MVLSVHPPSSCGVLCVVIFLCSVAHVCLVMEGLNGKPSVSEEARSLCSHVFKGEDI